MTASSPPLNPALVTKRPDQLRAWEFWVLFAIIVTGGVLRLVAMFDNFWMDEIWSWRIAQQLKNVLQVLTLPEGQSDNNHPLNTLFMYIVGDRAFWPIYRVLSLLCGVASIMLVSQIAMRFNRLAALVAPALLAISYPLVVYSSEARGYAPMLFFMLLAFEAIERFLETASWRSAVAFWIACILGVLAHLTFLQFYLAVVIWTVFVLIKRDRARALGSLMRLHVVPVVFFVVLYLVFVRNLTIGGAPPAPLASTVVSTMSLLIGGPERGTLPTYLFIVACVGVLAALDWVGARRTELLIFFALMIVVSPAIFLFVQFKLLGRAETIFPRYFLAPFTFALLLFAIRIGGLLRERGPPRIIAAAVLVLLIIGNTIQVSRFLALGRGHYDAAVAHLVSRTESPLITIVPTPDVARTQMILSYYQRLLPKGDSFAFDKPMPNSPVPAPEWLILNTLAGTVVPPEIEYESGLRYTLDREFPYYGLSGWAWQVYRLDLRTE